VARSTKPRSPRSRSAQPKDQTAQGTAPEIETPDTDTSEDSAVALTEPGADSPDSPPAGVSDPLPEPEMAGQDSIEGASAASEDTIEAAIPDDAEKPAPESGDLAPVPDTPPPSDDFTLPPEAAKSAECPVETGRDPSTELAPVPIQQARIASGPGFFTLLLGGVIAGIIGYLMSQYDVFDRGGVDPLIQIETRLGEQAARLDDLGGQASAAAQAAADASTAALAAATPDDIAALREDIAALRDGMANPPTPVTEGGTDPALAERLGAVEQRLDDLGGQVSALPTDPGASSEALAAYEKQLAALQEQMDSQRAAIAEARSSASDETRRISVQAALAQISAALENGAPFVDATSALLTAGGITVPDDLSTVAPEGVATLAALQNDFPRLARDALSVSIRETSDGGVLDRFGAFLRSQTGARSLNAREGDDPDAVLSRAEAAVKTGDLADALGELATLPPTGQTVMAPWVARAEARLAALKALGDLAATTNSN